MCGRFAQINELIAVIREFYLEETPDDLKLEKQYNIAPSDLIVTITQNGKKQLKLLKWGLTTAWSYTSHKYSLINIRGETLLSKKTFSKQLKKYRCLVYTNGFYEWEKTSVGKRPYYISMKNGKPFVMAGIWNVFTPENEEPVESCAIVTTQANSLVAEIHNRMPVILPENKWNMWLNTNDYSSDAIKDLLVPFDAEKMQMHEVSTFVNSPTHKGEKCIQPLPKDTLF